MISNSKREITKKEYLIFPSRITNLAVGQAETFLDCIGCVVENVAKRVLDALENDEE